ncbi:MAG TPA: SCP2 sterol-binding domain-containing protein [Thermoplasmata archaeon]|nr:SCP2 sterol-binding domain-containing protein [Thermoplasmata archaeon]
MRFPSSEWATAFQAALNASAEYREAASAWEGDLLLRVLPETAGGPAPGIHLDLFHGECRSARYVEDSSRVESEFVYEGPVQNWGRLVRGQLDPVKAILDGTFKIRGNLAKAMRFTRAAKELVEVAARIPVDG